MSLNLNLYAVTHRDGLEKSSPQQRADFVKVLEAVGLAPFSPVDSIPFVQVRLHAADWNHAHQIWRWFNDHVADGEEIDDEVGVDRETLQTLHDTCKGLLVRRNRIEAAATLPLPPDLFETKREENEYWREAYWPDVESTVEQLGAILSNPKFNNGWEFIYEVS